MQISSLAKATLATLFTSMAAINPAGAETVDGPAVKWNHSVWGKSRGFTAAIEELAAIVEEETGGKFKIKIHYGEALSKSKENLDGIKLGAFQSANFCNFYHPGKNPAYMVFSLPFLPITDARTSLEVRNAVMDHPALVADLDRWNAMAYTTTMLPIYQFMGGGDAPETMEDWSGMRVRAGGGIGEAMELLGATRTTMPAPEIYTSIQRGTVDAASLPFSYAFAAYKIPEVASWFTGNLSPGSAECPIVFNKTAWSKLPEQYQKVITDAKDRVQEAALAAYAGHDEKNLPAFREQLTEVTYSDDVLAKFQETAGKPIWDAWIEKNKEKFDAAGVLQLVFDTAGATN